MKKFYDVFLGYTCFQKLITDGGENYIVRSAVCEASSLHADNQLTIFLASENVVMYIFISS
jgi:hypothetical protein